MFGINGRLTMMGGDRYTPIPEGITFDEVMKRPDKSIPEDEIVDKFTSLTFPNIAYRVEF